MRECPRRHTNEHPRAERTQVLNTMRATGCEEVGVLDSGVGVVQASHYLPARLPPFPLPRPVPVLPCTPAVLPHQPGPQDLAGRPAAVARSLAEISHAHGRVRPFPPATAL